MRASTLAWRGARTSRKKEPQRRNLYRCGKGDGVGKSGGVDCFDWQLFDDLYDSQHVWDRSAGCQPDPARRIAFAKRPSASSAASDNCHDRLLTWRISTARRV